MDGLLVVDKPVGPTSHDVVARLRRILRERRIGHTGTLDPSASGVLPVVIGRATRLARFLSGAPKTYEAIVRLGCATTTGDAVGDRVGPAFSGAFPDRAAIESALHAFRGTFLQQPPAYSAKKIGGRRSYALVRKQGLAALPALPAPVSVTTHALEVVRVERDLVTLRVECSAGFYVRSLAQDLGAALGTGGHLSRLRRTNSGSYAIEVALSLEDIERDPERAVRRVVPLSGMLTDYPSVVLSIDGIEHARQGRLLQPADLAPGSVLPTRGATGVLAPGHYVRLLTPSGDLLALAVPSAWPTGEGPLSVLHPSVVLG